MKTEPAKSVIVRNGQSIEPLPEFLHDSPHRDLILRSIAAVNDFLSAQITAAQRGFIAGQILNEVKAVLPHGLFENSVRELYPLLPDSTRRRLMSRAREILDTMDAPPVDIEVSIILTKPENELPASALAWRQTWLDFTREQKLTGVESSGTHGELRGSYPAYIKDKLKSIGRFLRRKRGGKTIGYIEYTPGEQRDIQAAFESSMQHWPDWLLRFVIEVAKKILNRRA